jgi:tetratricopeptide (TPR) repeat protein
MKTKPIRWISALAVLAILSVGGIARGQAGPGQQAPVFSLKDVQGKAHDLSRMKDRPMIVLYFFDVASRPSQEGLFNLDRLAKDYKGADLAVWAVTRSPAGKVSDFAAKSGLGFPVLIDDANVSDLYGARLVLPTVCVVGPGLKVLDTFQGGGKTTEALLVRVAERTLQRKQTALAKAISNEVIRKNPRNAGAQAVKGHAALREGRLEEAEKTFKELAGGKDQGEVLGKEGLAAVYAKANEPQKALEMVREVERKAPDRSYVHVIKGDLLYGQDRKQEAEAAYRLAVAKTESEPYLDAVKFNQLGRLRAGAGRHGEARDLYEQAVAIDPYYIEGTTNKGLAYEKEGRWDKALETYRQALVLDRSDTFAAVLARKAQEMLDIQKDGERKKRMDRLVKDLAARFRSQKKTGPRDADAWTSGPTVLSFVDFQEKGGLAERDGFSTVLLAQLGDHLNASGRVQVVERVLMERLLEELNLGSSELADPETALRLGRVLAARLIGTGSLLHMPQGTLLSLRLIDTETSAIPQVVTRQMGPQASLEKELFQLNREILSTVIAKYPLRGYVARIAGGEAVVNIGARQGVVQGTTFDVLEEQEPVVYRGKTLRSAPKTVARAEVVRVEPDLCIVRPLDGRTLKVDDKVQERLAETGAR